MKTIPLIVASLLFSLTAWSQIGVDYNKRPKFNCDYLLVNAFSCENCSQADYTVFNLAEEIKSDVSDIFSKYTHCSLIKRKNIAEILSLGDNEQAITSLEGLTSTQREQIRNITTAQRVLFGKLRIQIDQSLLVFLEVVNLNTTDIEASKKFEIPKDEYLIYSKRTPYLEQNIARLILGDDLIITNQDDDKQDDAERDSKPEPTLPEPTADSDEEGTPELEGPGIARKLAPVFDEQKKKYETIEINGKRWLASNLRYRTANSKCYDQLPNYCLNNGQLYTWEEAKTACAALGPGWRLPTDQEWKDLASVLNGYYMIQADFSFQKIGEDPHLTYQKMIEGGASGFEAQLAGRRDKLGKFNEFGTVGFYWTDKSFEFDPNLAWTWMLMKINPLDGSVANATGPLPWPKVNGHSCRCINDLY